MSREENGAVFDKWDIVLALIHRPPLPTERLQLFTISNLNRLRGFGLVP